MNGAARRHQTPRLVGAARQFMITIALPKPQVRAMMPPGLELAAQDATPPSLHPVALAFGRNEGVRLSNMPCLFDLHYLESSVSIPWVRHRGPTMLTYTPRLFLDDLRSVLGGLLVWGFNKEMAHLRWGPRTYEVSSFVGDERLIDVQFRTSGPFREPSDFPYFSTLAEAMGQTKVEKTMLGWGPYVYSSLDWGGNGRLRIRPVEARIEIRRPFLPGLPAGVYQARGIDQAPLGAFELRTDRWQLSFPYLVPDR